MDDDVEVAMFSPSIHAAAMAQSRAHNYLVTGLTPYLTAGIIVMLVGDHLAWAAA